MIIITPYLVKPFVETADVQEQPEDQDDPLTESFAMNIRRTYKDYQIEDLLEDDYGYGYLID